MGEQSMDRVADIWGVRTPHARGTVWPARVDMQLDEGVLVDQVDSWVQSACVLCSNGCGCDIAVKDGRMVGVRGRAGDVVNHGRLGPKGLYGSTAVTVARGTGQALDLAHSRYASDLYPYSWGWTSASTAPTEVAHSVAASRSCTQMSRCWVAS